MPSPAIPAAARTELTPTGKLRAGINFQNMLLTTRGPNGEQGGVAVEFSRELAKRLGVECDIISYESAGSLAESVSSGAWEISVLGIEPARAEQITFAPALTEIEATYMVQPGSTIKSVADVDKPGIRIAVAAKSAYDLYLSRTIKQATLIQVQGLDAAAERFAKDKLEVLAGLKPALLEFLPTYPGGKLVDGNFYVVRHTVGTPKGHPNADAYLAELVEDVKAAGLVAEWIKKSGVKGLGVAPAGAR